MHLCRGEGRLVVGGRQVAEVGYGGWDEGEGLVDFFLRRELGEREADAGAGSGGA